MQQVAERVGYSRNHIWRLEQGATRPDGIPAALDRRLLDRLAETLAVDRAELYIAAGYVPPEYAERFMGIVRAESQSRQRTLDEAFAQVQADKSWKFGSSIGVWLQDLPIRAQNEYKVEVIRLYEASKGKRLLPEDWELGAVTGEHAAGERPKGRKECE